jgi:hypothetical protein
MTPFLTSVMNHPATVLFIVMCVFLFFLKFQGLSFQEFVITLNAVGTQPFALIVLIIGFWMLVVCKTTGIDTTIAGGVIGVASNMLTSQLKEASLHLSQGSSTQDSKTLNSPPTAPVPPVTPPPLTPLASQVADASKETK